MSVNVPSSEWRLRTAGGIPIKWVSHTGVVTDEEGTSSEIYIIKADQLLVFIIESFPAPIVVLGSLLYPPRRPLPGWNVLRTRKISWETNVADFPIDPFGADPEAPDGTYCPDIKVTIEYASNPENDKDPDPNNPLTFLEISADASGEFITSPTRGEAQWPGAEAVQEIDVPHVLVESLVEWTVRWSQIPHEYFNGILLARMRAALGRVNSAPMTVCYGSPAESVLFLGYNMRQQFTWRSEREGQPPVELELKFLEKNFTDGNGNRVHHNLVYRPGEGYQRMTIGGAPLYTLTDLNSIFLP